MNIFRTLLCTFFLLFFLPLTCGETKVVVCLHGFMRTKGNMWKIEKEYRKEGWTVINHGYPSRSKYIKDHAEDLVKELCIIAEKHPEQPIHFTTHSLGGIIVRAAINHPDCPTQAKQGCAVLIAPPNQGSSFARYLGKNIIIRSLMGPFAGQELAKKEDFNYLGQFPDTMKILVLAGNSGRNPVIRGKNDGKLKVEETFLLTPHMHKEVKAIHSLISSNSEVINHAKEFLKASS